MRKRVIIALWSIVAIATIGVATAVTTSHMAAPDPNCGPAPAEVLRYPAVEPIFKAHCNRCHNSEISDDKAAQAVYESSQYPFKTERKDLREGLEGMFRSRGGLTKEERCSGLHWLESGALDERGNRPDWY